MTMVGDVFSAYRNSTGTMVASPARLKGIYLLGTGTVTFRDGGSGGTIRATLASTGSHSVIVPASGIRFTTDIHITMTGVTDVTIFYG